MKRKGAQVQVACFAFATATVALLAMVAPPAAAAGAVDLDFRLAPGEDTGCRQWSGTGSVTWNLSLAMNGTDTNLTTPTYVWINDTLAPAMLADSWIVILAASGDQLASPPSYDNGSANELAIGSAVFAPGPGALDLPLYGADDQPPAPVTNITLTITPSDDSENKDHNFTIEATTHRDGSPNITHSVRLCVHIPPRPRWQLGNLTPVLQAVADSDITVSFWLKNTGNTQDWYWCNVSLPRDEWTWSFAQGINIGPNITNLTNIGQNITIRVRVHIPASARAGDNSMVSLECNSLKGIQLGVPIYVDGPYTRVEVTQYFYVSARIVGNSTLCGLPGDMVAFQIEVTNKGNGADHGVAHLVPPSNFSWASSITPAEFDLDAYHWPGDNASAQLEVTIPLGTPFFTYDFGVNVTSSVNFTTPITQLRMHVCVKQVYDPRVTQPPAQHATPGQEVVFSFTIWNAGNGMDSLLLDPITLPDWRLFLSPPIGEKLLQVNEEALFHATVVVPKDVRAGTYNLTVPVTSKLAQLDVGARIQQTVTLTVIVGETCGFYLSPWDTWWVVDSGSAASGTIPLSVEINAGNLGNAAAEVAFELEAPKVFSATLSRFSLVIEAFSSGRVAVRASVPNNATPGNFTLTVRATVGCASPSSHTATIHLQVSHGGAGVANAYTIRVGNVTFGPEQAMQSGASIEAVEQTNLTFNFVLHNVGDGLIPAGTPVLYVYDLNPGCSLRDPDPCQSQIVQTITLDYDLIAGGSLVVSIRYQVPEVVARPGFEGLASVNHTLRFLIPPGRYSSTGDVVEIQVRADDAPAAAAAPPTTSPPGTNPPVTRDPVVVSNPAGAALAIVAGLLALAAAAFFIVRRRRAA